MMKSHKNIQLSYDLCFTIEIYIPDLFIIKT